MRPSSLFSLVFPDRRDPANPGQYLCRFCGKPTLNTRRQYWCSDECHDLTQRAVSWYEARRLAWERDGGKCTICGRPVQLYEDGGDVAEIHHITPVRELWGTAWEAASAPMEELHWRRSSHDPEDPAELEATARRRVFALVYTILYLDINNLKTLCVPCHDIVHTADLRNQTRQNPFEVAPTYWARFWAAAERTRTERTLDEFFVFEEVAAC